MRKKYKGIENDVEVSLELFENSGFFYYLFTDYTIC